VLEWTVSQYRGYPYNHSDGRDNGEAGERVLRGGITIALLGWRGAPIECAFLVLIGMMDSEAALGSV